MQGMWTLWLDAKHGAHLTLSSMACNFPLVHLQERMLDMYSIRLHTFSCHRWGGQGHTWRSRGGVEPSRRQKL